MTSVVVAPFSSAWRDESAPSTANAQAVAVADPFTPIYRRGDLVVAWLVAAHLVLAALLAPVYDTWPVAAIVGIGAATMYYVCMAFAGGRFVTRNVAGLVLQTFCALHIYQMRGMAEMHFFFFTAVTAMIVYQDWRAMWLGVLAIIAQHTLFSVWHNEGVHPGGMAFFEPSRVSLAKIGFHFGIALVQVAFAAWCAHIWRSATERSFALDAAKEALEKSNERLAQRAASLEDQLRESRKLDAVGKLAGGVAHDFKTLLMVIQSHAEFALSPAETESMRRADLEQIRRAAETGTQLSRQLLTLGQKQALDPRRVDLNVTIGDTAQMIRRLAGAKVDVSVVTGRDLAGIWVDPGQILQVLLNLVVNASDAMPRGGRLRIETANVHFGHGFHGTPFTVIPPGEYVMLAVEDTGVGMSEDTRAQIF